MALLDGEFSLASLEAVTDPRVQGRSWHKLVDILVIALCGFIAGCDSWVDVALFGRSKRHWFERFLELPHGIPSHDTFGRVFALLNPEELVRVLRQFVQTVVGSLAGEAVAIDGKTLANSHGEGKAALHLVSAWATQHGVVLGQVATAEHSNEITAIPQLLRLVDIQGATISIDAMGCQRAIARQIRDQGADYVLAVKENQKNLHQLVAERFRWPTAAARAAIETETSEETNHGRTDRRTVETMSAPPAVRRRWPDADSIVRVRRETKKASGTEKEVRYFISSLTPNAPRLASVIRGHWGIENRLHWSLDVTFGEDQSRIRQGHAAENAGLLRRLALSIVKQDTWFSDSLRCKRLRAGWEEATLQHFLAIFSEN